MEPWGSWSLRTRPSQDSDLALIGFQVVALVLLAYMGTVAGREQRRAREAALRLARFDPLTGLYNRAHFFASMERELRLAERAGRGFAVLMLDLDGLKPVNDTFGHHYGDRLLQGVTEVIQHSVRATDTPARYGGDEFVILLPDTDAGGCLRGRREAAQGHRGTLDPGQRPVGSDIGVRRPRGVPGGRRHRRGAHGGRRCGAVRGQAEWQGPHRRLHHAYRARRDPHGHDGPCPGRRDRADDERAVDRRRSRPTAGYGRALAQPRPGPASGGSDHRAPPRAARASPGTEPARGAAAAGWP